MSRNTGPVGEAIPTFFGSLSRSLCGEFSDAWPLMQNPGGGDDVSSCDSCPELPGEDAHSLDPESTSLASLDSDSSRGLVGGAGPVLAHPETFTDTTDLSRLSDALREPVRAQVMLTAGNQLDQGRGDTPHLTTQPHTQVRPPARGGSQDGCSTDSGTPRGNQALMPENVGDPGEVFPSFIPSYVL